MPSMSSFDNSMSVDDVLPPPLISSSHYTRSKALTDFKFAGVLPFCILHGESYVFLGAEPVRTGPSGCLWKTMCTSLPPCRKDVRDDGSMPQYMKSTIASLTC